MRICLLTSAAMPPAEGIGFHVWGLARSLRREGHAVEIITRRRGGEPAEQRADGMIIRRPFYAPVYPLHVHAHGLAVARTLRQLADELDIVNAHSPLPPPVSGGLPLVATVHSPMLADTRATRRRDARGLAIRAQTLISASLERRLFRDSRVITAVARWIPPALSHYGVDARFVRVTGNAVDPGFFEARAADTTAPYGLYVGRLEASKGLLDLVEAAGLLEAAGACPDLRFILVGDGPLRGELSRAITDRGLGHRFRLRGQIDQAHRGELLGLYAGARLFVLPSHHEGLPTVLLEAMACRLPVIATACTGSAELVRNGETGLLVPVADPPALGAAVAALWNDRALCRALGARGREWVAQEHTWERVSERYLACYRDALSGKG